MEMAGPPGTLPDAFCPELMTSLHLPPVSPCGCSSPGCSTSREERVGEAGGPSPLPFLGGDPPPVSLSSAAAHAPPDPGTPTGCVRSHGAQWSLLGCPPSSAGAGRAQAWGICTAGGPQAGVLGAESPPEPGFPLCPAGKPPSALLGETSRSTGWALGNGGCYCPYRYWSCPPGRLSRPFAHLHAPCAGAMLGPAGGSVDGRGGGVLCTVPPEVVIRGRSLSQKHTHGPSSGGMHTRQAWCSHDPHPHPQTCPRQVERGLLLQASLGTPARKGLPRASGTRGSLYPGLLPAVGLEPDPAPCLSSEGPPLDLTGKVYQLEVMLKQLHTDLQKVRLPSSRFTWHAPPHCTSRTPEGGGGQRG